jgi:hypothetical protein
MIPNGAWRVLSRRLPVIPPLARALRADPEQGNFMIADSFGRRYPVETAHDHETGPGHGL